MQKQANSFECGVFSVAIVVDALDGNNDIGQNYNVKKVRFHFLTCLKNGGFSPFPRGTEKSKVCASTILFVDVYCICCRPFFEYEVDEDRKMLMANFSKCNEWYHGKCVTIPKNIFENSRLDWVCPYC